MAGTCRLLVPSAETPARCGPSGPDKAAVCPADTLCVLDAGSNGGSCVPMAKNGEACGMLDCASGLECGEDQTCIQVTTKPEAPLSNGLPCSTPSACASGICHDGVCASGSGSGIDAGCESVLTYKKKDEH